MPRVSIQHLHADAISTRKLAGQMVRPIAGAMMPGASVQVDREAMQRGVSALVQAALRHGGLEQVNVRVDGPAISISPVTAASGPVLLGEDLRDLGAAVAVLLIGAHGGSVGLDGDTLSVRFAE